MDMSGLSGVSNKILGCWDSYKVIYVTMFITVDSEMFART